MAIIFMGLEHESMRRVSHVIAKKTGMPYGLGGLWNNIKGGIDYGLITFMTFMVTGFS